MKNYLDFKIEYLDLCVRFGRDTKRKQKNDLKNDIIWLIDKIEYIAPKLDKQDFCYHLGEVCTNRTLRTLKTELEFSKQLLKELN